VMMGIRPADFSRVRSRRPDLILFFVLDSDDYYSSSRCAHNNNNNSQTGEKRVKESTRVFLFYIAQERQGCLGTCMFSGRDPAVVQQQTRDDVVFFSGIYYKIVRVCCTFPVLFP
jgi:hypothetical protein